jgi:hypothetical protein
MPNPFSILPLKKYLVIKADIMMPVNGKKIYQRWWAEIREKYSGMLCSQSTKVFKMAAANAAAHPTIMLARIRKLRLLTWFILQYKSRLNNLVNIILTSLFNMNKRTELRHILLHVPL